MSKKYLIDNNIDSNSSNKEYSSYLDSLLDMSAFNEDFDKYITYEFDENSVKPSWFDGKNNIVWKDTNWIDDFMKLFEK